MLHLIKWAPLILVARDLIKEELSGWGIMYRRDKIQNKQLCSIPVFSHTLKLSAYAKAEIWGWFCDHWGITIKPSAIFTRCLCMHFPASVTGPDSEMGKSCCFLSLHSLEALTPVWTHAKINSLNRDWELNQNWCLIKHSYLPPFLTEPLSGSLGTFLHFCFLRLHVKCSNNAFSCRQRLTLKFCSFYFRNKSV